MSRQKQLITVFGVANAQKQGVMGVRLALRAERPCFKRERHSRRADVGVNIFVTRGFI